MHVLQVTTVQAYPPSIGGGPRRIDGLVRARRTQDTVTRWCEVSYSVDRPSDPIEIDDAYYEHRYCSLPHVAADVITGQVGAPQVFSYWTTRISRTPFLDEWLEMADVILVELPYQFRYIEEHKPDETPIVYSSHNFEPDRLASLSDGWLSQVFYERIYDQERYAVTNADLVVVCSDRDEALYREHFEPATPLLTLPNAANLADIVDRTQDDSFKPASSPDIPDDALVCGFVGANYGPNIKAVEHILEINSHPEFDDVNVHFLVLGSVGESFTDRTVENVHFSGFVKDLSPWYAMCDVALNPITEGGGSNVKIPEYLAHGLPVVTTPFGARGFELEDTAFATIVNLEAFPEVLANFDRSALGTGAEAAREYVRSTLNWETVSSRLWEWLQSLQD